MSLDLTGLIKVRFPDGAKKGCLWKYSDSKEKFIFLAAPKGPGGEHWKKPTLFHSVYLFNGISQGAPLLTKLRISPYTKWFDEDGSGRQIWVSKFAKAKQLPKTPCTLVIDDKYYLVIERPRERND